MSARVYNAQTSTSILAGTVAIAARSAWFPAS